MRIFPLFFLPICNAKFHVLMERKAKRFFHDLFCFLVFYVYDVEIENVVDFFKAMWVNC